MFCCQTDSCEFCKLTAARGVISFFPLVVISANDIVLNKMDNRSKIITD